MGILNNNLGMNLTNEDPLINTPYGIAANNIPPIGDYFLELAAGNPPFLLLNGQYMTLLKG